MLDRNVEKITASRDVSDEYVMSLLSDLNLSFPDDVVLTIYQSNVLHQYTAHELVSDVVALGTVFVSMSLTGKVIAIAGQNSYNWLTAYLAAVCAGATALVIDPSLSPTTMSQQLSLAHTELALCDTDCYRKLSDRTYKSVAMLDEDTCYAVPSSVTSFIATGRSLIDSGYEEFMRISRQKSSTAHIAFDSGAYGRDKAVTLSGRSLYAQIVNAADAVGSARLFVAEHLSNARSLFCVIAAIAMGNRASFAHDQLNIYDAADILQPEMLIVSPQTVSDYYVEIWQAAKSEGVSVLLEKRIRTAMTLKYAGVNTRSATARILRKNGIALVRDILCFGNNIDEEISFGIHMLGVNMRCAYEVPECGIVAFMRKSNGKNTTLGEPSEDVYVKISSFGQILVKSDAAMSGYLGEGMYPDHWIPTGDAGDYQSGQIVLTNDSHRVYITEGAKRIFPERLSEMMRKQIPYAHTVAVVIQNGEVVLHIGFDSDFVRITGKYELRRIVSVSVDGVNKCLGDYEQITRIVIDDIA